MKKKPNILLILIDDMGWKDIQACGSTFYESPTIDRLMSEGMVLTTHTPHAPYAPLPGQAYLQENTQPQ